jgi:hypothetical protein
VTVDETFTPQNPQNALANMTLDGVPTALALEIRRWETEALVARNTLVDKLYGGRFTGEKGTFTGMKGIVLHALYHYVSRGWELPPFSYTAVTQDIDHLSYPWFFGNIQHILPIAAPSEIRLKALPLRGDKKKFASQANSVLEEESEYLKLDQHNQALVLGTKFFGSQIAFYGHRETRGPLNIERIAETCDPLSILWEPGATSIRDAKYIIWKRPVLIDDARRAYNIEGEIRPEDISSDFSTNVLVCGAPERGSDLRCVETLVFIRDSEKTFETIEETVMVPYEVDLGDGEASYLDEQPPVVELPEVKKTRVETYKYPYGRIVVLVNNKIVYDQPNPYDHHLCPFTKLDNYSFPGIFWGLAEWFVQGDMPHIVNEGFSGMVKSMRRSFPKLFVRPEAIEGDVDDITNDPDDIGKLTDQARGDDWFKKIDLTSTSASQHAMALLQTINVSDKVTGVTDPLRGQGNPEVTSGKQQQLLTEQAASVQHPFVKKLERHYAGEGAAAGVMILRNAVQFRPPEDIVEITSNIGLPAQPFALADFPRDVEFRIKIAPFTGLPTDRKERLAMLLDIIPQVLQVYQASPELANAVVSLSDIPELEEAWVAATQKLEAQRAAALSAAPQSIQNPIQPVQ